MLMPIRITEIGHFTFDFWPATGAYLASKIVDGHYEEATLEEVQVAASSVGILGDWELRGDDGFHRWRHVAN